MRSTTPFATGGQTPARDGGPCSHGPCASRATQGSFHTAAKLGNQHDLAENQMLCISSVVLPPRWINYRSSNKKEGVGVLKQASWLQEGDRHFAMKSRPKERAAPCWTLLFPIHLISLSKSPASPTPYLFSSFTTSPPSPSNSPYGCLSRSVTSL